MHNIQRNIINGLQNTMNNDALGLGIRNKDTI